MAAVFAPRAGVGGRLPVIGEMTSGGLIGYQGNQQRGTPLTTPLIRTITSWDRGKYIARSVSCVRNR